MHQSAWYRLGPALVPVQRKARLARSRQMAPGIRAACNPGDRLRVVFVSTEVAPWSKVGGLADVLASLPEALAARGHTVLTVAPRYSPYPDTTPTGISVPLELPPECYAPLQPVIASAPLPPPLPRTHRRSRKRKPQPSLTQEPEPPDTNDTSLPTDESLMPREAELFSVHQGGVERVFVDHPELRAENIYGPSSSNARGSFTYMEAGQLNGLDLRYSILCQAALGAAALMPWEMLGTDNYNTSTFEKTLADLEGTTSTSSGSPSDPDQDSIVFVANDWPTALQLLRLQYIIRAADSRTPSSEGTDSHIPASFRSLLSQRLINAATVVCIHNLAYQGIFPGSIFPRLCLPATALTALDPERDWREALVPSSSTPTSVPLITNPQVGLINNSIGEDLGLGSCGCPPTEPCTCIENLNMTGQGMASTTTAPAAVVTEVTGEERKADADEAALGLQDTGTAGQLNFMRAALVCADEIVTVSPSYAQEIQTEPAMGCGLHDILVAKGVTGIMNGIDTNEWNPATDIYLPPSARFDHETMIQGKAAMKAAVQHRLGLAIDPDAALVVFIGRLTEQKGLDVMLGAIPTVLAGPPTPSPCLCPQPCLEASSPSSSSLNVVDCRPYVSLGRILDRPLTEADEKLSSAAQMEEERSHTGGARGRKLQLAMLGTGDAWMEAALGGLERSFPGQAVGITAFSEELAHWLLAAADYVLVPSRFEPCGLIAQCGVRYGAVPIVTAVGGLKDLVQPEIGYTVPPLGPPGDSTAQRADVQRLAQALRLAARESGSETHREMQRKCMGMELSWERPAEAWENILHKAAQLRRHGHCSAPSSPS